MSSARKTKNAVELQVDNPQGLLGVFVLYPVGDGYWRGQVVRVLPSGGALVQWCRWDDEDPIHAELFPVLADLRRVEFYLSHPEWTRRCDRVPVERRRWPRMHAGVPPSLLPTMSEPEVVRSLRGGPPT